MAGDLVVKKSKETFNQVDPDQAQEWRNAIRKKSGWIIVITKTSSALNGWALSFNLRTQIANDTQEMLGISTAENIDHDQNMNDSLRSHDIEDENKLFNTFKRFGVFGDDLYNTLQTLVIKDVATEDMQISLINVEM